MFQVVWDETALDELATAWMGGDSSVRQAITFAAEVIERQLQHAPERQGESRADGRRVIFHAPLGVAYEVDMRKSLVRVLHAWRYRQRGPS